MIYIYNNPIETFNDIRHDIFIWNSKLICEIGKNISAEESLNWLQDALLLFGDTRKTSKGKNIVNK